MRLIDADALEIAITTLIYEFECRMPKYSSNDMLTSGIDTAKKYGYKADGAESVLNIVRRMPTIETKPINHGWISIEDRLPNTGQKVIVWEANKKKIDVNEFAGKYEGWYYRNDNITHWQPFPEPPEGSNKP